MNKTVRFKSWPVHWEKEKNGLKPNTVRKKDLDDARHLMLGAMMVSGDYGQIAVHNTETQEVFYRVITDVTEFDGYLIISWRHSE